MRQDRRDLSLKNKKSILFFEGKTFPIFFMAVSARMNLKHAHYKEGHDVVDVNTKMNVKEWISIHLKNQSRMLFFGCTFDLGLFTFFAPAHYYVLLRATTYSTKK